MSLRNSIQEIEYDVPYGLDTTTPIAAVKPGFVREALNVNIGYSGGYTKRDGYTNQLSSVFGSRDITFGVEYKTTTSINRVVIFGTDGTASGGIVGYVNAGAITNISTSLSGTVRPVLTQFDDSLFFYNGVDSPFLYDGTNTRQVGITAPTTAPTLASQTTGGSLTLLGNYVFAYTYYNSVTGAESSPSPFSSVIALTGSNNQLTLTVVAGSSTTADTIRVYRTYSDSSGPLWLDQTASIGSTSVVIAESDASLGRQLELDNSRIEDLTTTAQYAVPIENRIFLKSGSNEVRWSKIGQEGPMPESFEVKAVENTTGKFGAADDIVGIARISQVPIILKEKSFGRLDPIGIPDNTQSNDNVLFQYREISDVYGAVSHWASVQVESELLFLGKDNIYATNGVTVRRVADTIKNTIKSLGFSSTQKPRLSAHNDVENSRVYFSVFSSTSAVDPDLVLVGDYQLYPNFRWTLYSKGDNATTHPGIQSGCFFAVTNSLSGKLDTYFGNVKANGKLYKMNTGDNDDSLGIFMKLTTRPYFGDSPLKDKLYKLSEVQVLGNGNDYDITICSIYDLSGQEEECCPLNLSSDGFVYDAVISLYDTATYSDDSVKSLDYNMHRRAKFMQLVFKQTEADAPINLFGWGVASSAIGLRAK